ncbi:uncharacterized protein LY89DRAFT_712271 [Mollisia scopiformis]|uniref:Uncharacterized protein n=1 Tax=Mollisia scopiformis TaxID=149040 RepID=A0A132B3H3_MOLSC|nr:uncharacterized protein LY89DRAFT_712271 [Mollisia scopiformis]KUJ06940.1 hypothetical protein LY89DRAFT_712271 [Mollisia scopiformis]
MKFSVSLLSSVLLATTALSAPHTKNAGLSRRLQRRARTIRDSGNRAKDSSTKTEASQAASSSSSSIEYSENWSGLAYTSPPSGETFNAVSGKFTVPTPSIPSGVDSTDGEYSASAWVGIDGNTYSTAILQTGVDFTVSTSGEVSYDAWYEWYPDYAYDFDLTISAGDVIAMYVNATTTTSGSATIENLTTGKTVTKSLTSTSALGGENAEWIVEDFEEGDSLIAFADFGNVTFTECVASTSSSSEGVTDAQVMDIENSDDEVLTSVTLISDSSFEMHGWPGQSIVNTYSR